MIYILINVAVSALTTLSVLFLWNQATWQQNWFCNPSTNPTPVTIPTVFLTYPPSDLPVLEIENVIGVGEINNEVVMVKRVGEGDLSLKGWKIVDEQDLVFTFPSITISKGTIHIYSRSGIDSVKDLYWNQKTAVWQTGDKVKLFDPAGNLRSEYVIP